MGVFGQRELATNTNWSSVHNPLGNNVKVENGGSLNIFSVELLLCHTAANGSLDLNRKISIACQMDSVKARGIRGRPCAGVEM